MEVKINRNRTALAISGMAVMAFGIWSVIRLLLAFFSIPREVQKELYGPDFSRVETVFIIVLAVIGIIVVAIHVFMGLSARSEAIKGKKRYAYLVIAVFMIAFSIYGIVIEITMYSNNIFGMVVQLLVSITEIAAMAEMFIASVTLKALNRKGN